jgi:hypothetical protein
MNRNMKPTQYSRIRRPALNFRKLFMVYIMKTKFDIVHSFLVFYNISPNYDYRNRRPGRFREKHNG